MLKNLRQHEEKAMSSGGTTTLQVPAYAKIHNIILNFKKSDGSAPTMAQIKSEVNKIRFTINGIDYVNSTVTQLFKMYEILANKVANNVLDNGTIELNLGRLLFDNPLSRDLFGMGTADVSSMQVQITAGTLTNVASVAIYTSREARTDAVLSTVAKYIEYPQSYNAVGEHTVDTLPRNTNEDYLAVIVDQGAGASAVVSSGECTMNSQNIFDKTPSNINASYCSSNGFKQLSNEFIYLFNNGSVNDRLPMVNVKDLRLKTTFSTAPGSAGYSLMGLVLTNVPRTTVAK